MKIEKMKSLIPKSKAMLALTVFLTIVVVVIAGLFTYEMTKNSVALNLDGKVKEISTHADTVNDIFVELDIPFKKQDYISPSLDTEVTDDMEIQFITAHQVVLTIDGNQEKVWTTTNTVADFLKEQNIAVKDHDELNVKKDTFIKDGLEVIIDVAFKTVVNDGGKDTEYWSTSTTVADFLEQQGIKLNELDRVEPELETVLEGDSLVKVIRVEKVTDVVEEQIDFAVVTKKDDSLLKDTEKVVQEGQNGVLQKKYEITLENGKEVSKELVGEDVVKESKDKIVAVGTKVITTVASRGASAGEEFYVTATAYTPFCNGCNGYSATGLNLKANPDLKVIAVDPSVIPLGTKVWVEGYGYAVAADTGGSIKGNKIDVLFQSKSDAYKWGRKKVLIKILE